jgi:hypothetical protein
VTRRLILLGVVLAALVGADVVARGYVETTVNTRAKAEAPPDTSISASIRGFPFLPRLLLGSEVKRADIHIQNIKADVLAFAVVDINLWGVHLDRGRLMNDRKARITAIDHGTVTATVTADALGDALRVPVKMADGVITVRVLNQQVTVTPKVTNGRLTLTGALGRSFSLVIPSTDFVPCVGEVSVEEGRMRLSCEIHDVPPALLDAVQNAS